MQLTLKTDLIILTIAIALGLIVMLAVPAFALITETDMQDMFEGFVQLILAFYGIGLAGGLIIRMFKKADSR